MSKIQARIWVYLHVKDKKKKNIFRPSTMCFIHQIDVPATRLLNNLVDVGKWVSLETHKMILKTLCQELSKI